MNRHRRILLVAAFAAVAIVQAQADAASKGIVVESPSDLPEVARARSEAMYLQHTGSAQAVLYLEQDQGRKLAMLDVTDPNSIRVVGQVSIDAPAPYDFVQDFEDSGVLIHYRNHSGFAVISFKNYKHPILKPEPDYLHPASPETDGPNGLLLVSSNAPRAPVGATQYEVVSVSNPSNPTPIATIHGVFQRLDRPRTGTIFLLSERGLTVVRCLASEREHKIDLQQKTGN